MRKPVIAIKTRPKNFDGLITLGLGVIENMTNNPNFISPTPSVAELQSQVALVQQLFADWGTRSDRGSHLTYVTLCEKALSLSHTLKSMAFYVQITAMRIAGNDYAQMTTIMVSSGFPLVKTKEPQGVLQPVQNLQAPRLRTLNRNRAVIWWKQPLGVTSENNVRAYKVYRGVAPDFALATLIATVTRAEFFETNNSTAMQTWFYWIVPVGVAGDGVVSNMIEVTLGWL